MSNFTFIEKDFPTIFKKMSIAESRVFTEPKSAAHYTRLALEEVVQKIYKWEQLELPYDSSLSNLLRQSEFSQLIGHSQSDGLHIVRKTGNIGAHYGKSLRGRDALISIKYMYDFLKWFANYYADEQPELPEAFDKTVIPKAGSEERKLKTIREEVELEKQRLESELEKIRSQLEAEREAAKESEEKLLQYQLEQKKAKEKLKVQKQKRKRKISSEFNEAETRQHLIDLALKEAGWTELQEGRDLEFPVDNMPVTRNNPKGNGYIDYVLWNDDGLPLAIIEAKRTSINPENGRYQAEIYADCLEAKYGQRPIIFYTNGYKTFLWDDAFYSLPRRVYGFYTKDELQWCIQRRQTRKDIRGAQIDQNITNRPYQIEGIQRVMEALTTSDSRSGKIRGAKRHALLVMATGSGKTRTSASIVDILISHNWVKRVLFLADRNALVTQAKNAFAQHLPELSAIDLTQEKENNTTRLVFSTYQTVINKIDQYRTEEGRFYGVGHFDLIIVDEAHRSVYNKYGVIFEYFDSLLLGLTATPKRQIDHNTYELFECTEGNPTFAYELDDAVQQGFLTPYKNIDVSTGFIREGIHYKDLSPKEKEKYEEQFRDDATGLFPEHIRNSAINRWLFNRDTVNKVLDKLMSRGLKIENGDLLGRTIIFAANQKHADFIRKCFEERYPQYPSGFMEVVHNKKSHAQGIIERFCDHHKENLPQVAVSVDMMDTGIDAPRVLNLVFFKVVRSFSKFWQMLGRGTRLCPDVFGPGREKEYFLVFDACQNFDFFEENQEGTDGNVQASLTTKIFKTRLHVARLLRETGEEEDRELSEEMIDKLHGAILALDKQRFDVNMQREYVDAFENRERWARLDEESIHIIENHLAHLPIPESINEKARRFDLMMLKMHQARLLMEDSEMRYRENLIEIAEQLSQKYAIPQVKRSKALIESMRNPDFYKELKQKKLDEIRIEIRELMQFLEESQREIIETDYEDELEAGPEKAYEPTGPSEHLYRKEVERFIREHQDHLVISKLKSNQHITDAELEKLQSILFDGGDRGTYQHYKEIYGDQPLGKFIRNIVGLDRATLQEAFAGFLSAGNLSADQMTFINNIIKYLSKNGTIDKSLLFQPPFTHTHDQGLIGMFDDAQVVKIISLLDRINQNAVVG